MRFHFARAFGAGLLLVAPVGCGPNRVVDEPPQRERIEINVDTDGDSDVDNDPDAGVDVRIGGGQGIQVDVDPNEPGTDVNVGGNAD